VDIGQGFGQVRRLIDILVDQAVAQFPDPQPGIGGIEPAIPFRTVEIRDDRLRLLAAHAEDQGQEFVTEQILKPAEPGNECLDPFRNHRIEPHGLCHIRCFCGTKQPITGCKQIAFLGRSDGEKMMESDSIWI
jgi:hypothetical protein